MQKRHYRLFLVCIVQCLLISCQVLDISREKVISIQSDTLHPVSNVLPHSLVPLPSSKKSEQLMVFTNANTVNQILIDNQGNPWTAGGGGVVQWYPQDGRYQKYTILDGLPDNSISAIGIDNHNQIWAGSHNGYISRYDGHNWISQYPKLGEIITTFAFAKDDTLWVGTNRGVFHYDGNQWIFYTTQQGLLDNYIQSLAIASNGMVWVGLIGGVSSFDGISWRSIRLMKGSVVDQIVEAPDNTIWFSMDCYLVHMSEDKFITFRIDNSLKNITAIAINHKGEIWLSVGKIMIGKFDEENRSFVPYSVPDISSIVFDQTDKLWLGNFQVGISEFDGQKQDQYQTKEDLSSNFVLSSAKGTDGSLWFGTFYGVSRYDGIEWHNYTTKDGLVHNSVLAIASAPDGSLWFGTEDGISHYDGNSWRNYDTKDGLPDNRITAITIAADGSVWAVSQSGISHYTEDIWRVVSLPAGFLNTNLQVIATGKGGQVLVIIQNGFAFLKGNSWVIVDIGSNAPITSIAISEQGDMWFGTLRTGVIFMSNIFSEQVIAQISSGPVAYVQFNSDNSVNIKNSGGNLPISGVFWQQFTEKNGLPDDSVSLVSIDQSGMVYVATKSGVARILDFQVVPYSGEAVLQNQEVRTIVQDQIGNMWFVLAQEGVISLKP